MNFDGDVEIKECVRPGPSWLEAIQVPDSTLLGARHDAHAYS